MAQPPEARNQLQQGVEKQPRDRGPKIAENAVKRRYESVENVREVLDQFSMRVNRVTLKERNGGTKDILHPEFYKGATLTGLAVNGKLYMTREDVYGTNENNIELAGGVNPDKDSKESARKMVKAEMGADVTDPKMPKIASIRSDTGTFNVTDYFVSTTDTVGDQQPQRTIKKEPINRSDLRWKVTSGEINTASVALYTLLTADHLDDTRKDQAKPPAIETTVLSGKQAWMDESPGPWKVTSLRPAENDRVLGLRAGHKLLAREVLEETDTEQLVHDKVIKPDAKDGDAPGDQYMLNYPRQTSLVPVDIDSGKVYLMKDQSLSYGEEIFTLPNTSVETDETSGEAAKRLVAGELGVEPTDDRLYNLGVFGETTSRFNYKKQMIAVSVTAAEMANNPNYIAVDIDKAWEAVKATTDEDKDGNKKDAKELEKAKIDGTRLDTLTPALAVGLLKNIRLQKPEPSPAPKAA